MITFSHRSSISEKWGALLDSAFLGSQELRAYGLFVVRYGVEDSMVSVIHNHLMRSASPVARHLRYRPDRVLCFDPPQGITANHRGATPSTRFLEYKMTLTPRFSDGPEQYNRGQMEANAFDEYMRLTDAGLDVLLFVYCPYHSRPLLAGHVPTWQHALVRGRQTTLISTGSGTPYVNFDLTQIPSLHTAMHDLFGVPEATTADLCVRNIWPVIKRTPEFHPSRNLNDPALRNRTPWPFPLQESSFHVPAHEASHLPV